MTDSKSWRLLIDSEDYTEDCEQADINMPRLVYDVPHDEGAQRRVGGPGGFSITLISPSERLLALVDGGKRVHLLRFVIHGQAIPAPVQFHEEWTERGGVRKMFGCLAVDRRSEPKWVTEPQLAEA